MLIDEPEAFLHPPQALKLGELIAAEASSDRQVVIATHSSSLLRGILGKTTDVQVVRITRRGDANAFNVLTGENLQKMAHDPVLGSSRVTDGMFYPGVAVVEADADSSFYHKVHRRADFAEDLYFVHAHNKQSLPKIVSPYRKLGVRCAAIADFDLLRVREDVTKLLDAMGVGAARKDEILEHRDRIASEIEAVPLLQRTQAAVSTFLKAANELKMPVDEVTADSTLSHLKRVCDEMAEDKKPWTDAKKRGRDALSAASAGSFDSFDALARSEGIFVCPGGELESWLIPYGLGRAKNKNVWITSALAKLTELSPDLGEGPWQFISAVQAYLAT